MTRFIFLVTFLLLNLASLAQKTGSAQNDSLLHLSGKIIRTSLYQGGAEVPEEMAHKMLVSNTSFLLVRSDDTDSKPIVISKITTNEDGEFDIKVEPGFYGILEIDEKPRKGSFLPLGYSNYGEHEYSSSYWEIEGFTKCIEVSTSDVTDITIYNHQRSGCLDCP